MRVDSPARDSNFNLSCWYSRMKRVEVPNGGHGDARDVEYFLNKTLSFQSSIRHCFSGKSGELKRSGDTDAGLRLDWVKRAGETARATCVTRRPATPRPCVSSRAPPEETHSERLELRPAPRTEPWVTQVKWRALTLWGETPKEPSYFLNYTLVRSSYQQPVVRLRWSYAFYYYYLLL